MGEVYKIHTSTISKRAALKVASNRLQCKLDLETDKFYYSIIYLSKMLKKRKTERV